ncbi:hypothetical protein ASC77_21465 [Nocardioides sp. Root1257]|uniref:glycosyltransferase family 39 protein n=1 Tax=unclassified Nocardioides TaxID=2615069 RepID=UPI0006F55BBF|nr:MULTISPECIES: glycosyltransferase family 39 protein [unclassified Nocardioides]KQW43965.1 hypothetical protein ASC77_21465 [Nocardioides sp. Root1257]KRC42406.1 hypothetical protein ASE24_21260 [Nocardioides sp. Root224]
MTSLLPRPVRPPAPRGLLERRGTVAVVAAVAALMWLPNLARPLSSDEGGFLLVASQWSPGTSLYGDYWVDRPPLLIGIFRLADLGGGLLALRLIGLLAVVASVLLAGRIGELVAPGVRRAPVLVAATAGVFMTTPLFGTSEVDGELLAVPFVLASVLCSLLAVHRSRGRWWLLAGATAMAAPLVKQSMLDGFVLAATLFVWLLTRRRTGEALDAIASFGLGAGGLFGVVLAWAASRGTGPLALWDAVVVFRADAAAVISAQANSATPGRAMTLLLSFLASGALVLVVLAFLPGRRRTAAHPDVRLLATALLAWETVGIAFGGSYWLHYLVGLVPGLVLAASALAAHRPARARWAVVALAYAAVVGIVSTAGVAVHDGTVPSDVAVARYLAAHKAPGDTGVVGFGNPAILEAAGLSSPYPQLWSLPVRVLDPRLREFTHVITGPHAPTWAVVNGTSLATWGVDARTAQPAFDQEYRLVEVAGDYHVYHLR